MRTKAEFVAFCYALIAGLVTLYLLTLSPVYLIFAGTVGVITLTFTEEN